LPSLRRIATAAALAITTTLVAVVHDAPARAAAPLGSPPVKIMALGDSITLGYPTPSGYRQGLADRLNWAGYDFDFVGSQSSGPPLFKDREHEGHGGYRIDQIRAGARRWVATYQPDVVLLMIGTNDFLGNYDTERAPARLARLLDTISRARPTASILVASIPPITGKWCDCDVRVTAYNAAVRTMVTARERTGYPVSFVDMSAVTKFDLADGIHPSEVGHAKVADAWERAILRLPPSPRVPGPTPVGDPTGYWLVGDDGGVFAFGAAKFFGSTGAIALRRPIVGMAPTPTGEGYWLVAADGGVFAFGDATFFGSTGGLALNKPIVGMAAVPTGRGYWLVAADGGIFAFGDARFFGSTGAISLNRPIVAMAATPSGGGYWFVASDGGIFSFGDARFAGSTGGAPLAAPITAMAATPTGDGYWFVASDGGTFSFGDAPYLGSAVGGGSNAVIGIAHTPTGEGYVLATTSGELRAFGDAAPVGSLPTRPKHSLVAAQPVG